MIIFVLFSNFKIFQIVKNKFADSAKFFIYVLCAKDLVPVIFINLLA